MMMLCFTDDVMDDKRKTVAIFTVYSLLIGFLISKCEWTTSLLLESSLVGIIEYESLEKYSRCSTSISATPCRFIHSSSSFRLFLIVIERSLPAKSRVLTQVISRVKD